MLDIEPEKRGREDDGVSRMECVRVHVAQPGISVRLR